MEVRMFNQLEIPMDIQNTAYQANVTLSANEETLKGNENVRFIKTCF
jgi:hypothetical protein